DAITNAINSSDLVPKPMIIVEAKNKPAHALYVAIGFSPFPNNPNKLFMLQKEAEKMLREAGVL
ncbi:hypothetical protein QR76_19165, partial [Vibrio anguillarum]|nr:hypothetical protein [Vibrio anguillarum]